MLVDENRTSLAELCGRFRSRGLDLFGSAAAGAFDPVSSELDFVVEFLPSEKPAPDYFGRLHALEDLFGRRIDLVMERAMTSPYFRRGIEQSRRPVYGG